jgi:hypothetical protein
LKSVIAGTVMAVAVLVAASMLGVAAAEAPTASAPPQTVSVEGVASVPIAQEAEQAAADAAYHQALAAAEADGHEKAELLASKAGSTVGAVQQIAERGGSIECGKPSAEASNLQYEGAQPDFGYVESSGTVQAPTFAAAPKTAVKVAKHAVKKHKKKKKRAKAASGFTCTLSAQVSLVYLLG